MEANGRERKGTGREPDGNPRDRPNGAIPGTNGLTNGQWGRSFQWLFCGLHQSPVIRLAGSLCSREAIR